MKDLKMGSLYQIEWYDHFSSVNKNSKQAVTHEDVVLVSFGRFVGASDRYVVLAENWESDTSENNDNIHILKVGIKSVKELK